MIIYKNLKDFEKAPEKIQNYFSLLLKNSAEWLEEHPEDSETLFLNYLGGSIYLLESLDEIGKIDTSIPHPVEDRWFTLSEVSDSFDICEWILDHQYVQVVMITSNTGGSTYIIPRNLAIQHRFLLDSLDKTNNDISVALED